MQQTSKKELKSNCFVCFYADKGIRGQTFGDTAMGWDNRAPEVENSAKKSRQEAVEVAASTNMLTCFYPSILMNMYSYFYGMVCMYA